MVELDRINDGGAVLFLLQAADSYLVHNTAQAGHAKLAKKFGSHQSSSRSEQLPEVRLLDSSVLPSPTRAMNEIENQNETDPVYTAQQALEQASLATEYLSQSIGV